jgi:hypothetical protein
MVKIQFKATARSKEPNSERKYLEVPSSVRHLIKVEEEYDCTLEKDDSL